MIIWYNLMYNRVLCILFFFDLVICNNDCYISSNIYNNVFWLFYIFMYNLFLHKYFLLKYKVENKYYGSA